MYVCSMRYRIFYWQVIVVMVFLSLNALLLSFHDLKKTRPQCYLDTQMSASILIDLWTQNFARYILLYIYLTSTFLNSNDVCTSFYGRHFRQLSHDICTHPHPYKRKIWINQNLQDVRFFLSTYVLSTTFSLKLIKTTKIIPHILNEEKTVSRIWISLVHLLINH